MCEGTQEEKNSFYTRMAQVEDALDNPQELGRVLKEGMDEGLNMPLLTVELAQRRDEPIDILSRKMLEALLLEMQEEMVADFSKNEHNFAFA